MRRRCRNCRTRRGRFDRVVTWSLWQITDIYGDSENFSYWNRFGIPKTTARYFSTDTVITGFIEFGPWPLWTWWDEGRAK